MCSCNRKKKTPRWECVRRGWESKRGAQSGEGGLIMLMKCMHVGWCKQSVPTWAAGPCETELSNVLPVRGVPRHTSPTRFKAEGAMVNRVNSLFTALPASLGPGTNTLRHSSPLLCLSWHLCNMSGAEGVQVLCVCVLWTGDVVEGKPVRTHWKELLMWKIELKYQRECCSLRGVTRRCHHLFCAAKLSLQHLRCICSIDVLQAQACWHFVRPVSIRTSVSV